MMVNHPKLEFIKYRCLRILARGERTLKCGRRGCGTMLPKLGDKCNVCKSVVIEVQKTCL